MLGCWLCGVEALQSEAQALFAVVQLVGLVVRALAQEFCGDVCQLRLCIWGPGYLGCLGSLAQPLQLACCAQLGQQGVGEGLEVGVHGAGVHG